MYEPVTLSDGSPGEAALGYFFHSFGKKQVQGVIHDGANAGWRVWFVAIPEHRKGIVILTNNDNASEVLTDLVGLWADAEF